jgi:surfactin synthase thioesterase subunit
MDGKPASYTLWKTLLRIIFTKFVPFNSSRGAFSLGGYCFGRLIAFEIAQQLKAQNEDTLLLFLLDPPEYVAALDSGRTFRPRSESVSTLRSTR